MLCLPCGSILRSPRQSPDSSPDAGWKEPMGSATHGYSCFWKLRPDHSTGRQPCVSEASHINIPKPPECLLLRHSEFGVFISDVPTAGGRELYFQRGDKLKEKGLDVWSWHLGTEFVFKVRWDIRSMSQRSTLGRGSVWQGEPLYPMPQRASWRPRQDAETPSQQERTRHHHLGCWEMGSRLIPVSLWPLFVILSSSPWRLVKHQWKFQVPIV